ncbi:MAG: uracil-DNA glycosylase, partial [Nannocystaceae bacterium]
SQPEGGQARQRARSQPESGQARQRAQPEGGQARQRQASPRAKQHASTSKLPVVSDPRGGAPAPTKPKGDPRSWPPARKLEYLRYHIGDCQRCQLARTRTTIVFGSGNPEAQILLVGEAPGADEDRQGLPFVGRAGQRLTQMLRELSIERSDVYIANVLKCRPPRNRDPQPEEVHACSKFLEAQIRAIAPRVIVALGRHAGMLMLRREMTLREMRGRQWTYEQAAAKLKIPLYITYHPSFVLRQESDARRNSDNPSEAHATVVGDLREAFSVIRAASDGHP